MLNADEFLNYIKERKRTTVPELQEAFSADYFEVRKALSSLTEKGIVSLVSGVVFEYRKAEDRKDGNSRMFRVPIVAQKREPAQPSEVFLRRPDVTKALGELAGGVPVNAKKESAFVSPEDLFFNGKQVRFELSLRNGRLCLSDGGAALEVLSRAGRDPSEIEELLAPISVEYAVEAESGELCIALGESDNALCAMIRLYTAMNLLIASALAPEERADRPPKQTRDLPAPPKQTRDLPAPRAWGSAEDSPSEDCPPEDKWYTAPLTAAWDSREEEERYARCVELLLHTYHIGAKICRVYNAPAYFCYELELDEGEYFSSLSARENEFALRLALRDGLRILKGDERRILLEVPKQSAPRQWADAAEIVRNEEERFREEPLVFALGQKAWNENVLGSFADLRHLLLAGGAASGKSTLLHTIIYSLITHYPPEEVRLLLCDFGGKEFSRYRGEPHLLTREPLGDPRSLVACLGRLRTIMEERLRRFAEAEKEGIMALNLGQYNAQCKPEDRLPYLVLLVDDLGDFLSDYWESVNEDLTFLLGKARAAGIFLTFAAKENEEESLPGIFIFQFRTRCVFRTAFRETSFSLLGDGDAQKLLGKGDMLLYDAETGETTRIQAARVGTEESARAVEECRRTFQTVPDGSFEALLTGGDQ